MDDMDDMDGMDDMDRPFAGAVRDMDCLCRQTPP